MNELIAKIRVIAKATVTLLSAVLVFVTTVTPMLPEDWMTVAANIAAGITTAIATIRRHTPVTPDQYGILAPDVETVTVHEAA